MPPGENLDRLRCSIGKIFLSFGQMVGVIHVVRHVYRLTLVISKYIFDIFSQSCFDTCLSIFADHESWFIFEFVWLWKQPYVAASH